MSRGNEPAYLLQMLKSAFDASLDGMLIVDLQSRVIMANKAARGMAHPDFDFNRPLWDQPSSIGTVVYDGKPMAFEERPHVRALHGEVLGDARFLLKSDDGTEIHFSASASPIRNKEDVIIGAVVVYRDVTARVHSELVELERLSSQELVSRSEAHEAREAVVQVLDRVASPVFFLDKDWRVTYLNVAAEQICRMNRTFLLGFDVWKLFPEFLGTEFDKELRRAIAEDVPVRFVGHSKINGDWIEVHAYPCEGTLSVFLYPLTQQKRAEEVLHKLQEATEHLASQSYHTVVRLDRDMKLLSVNQAGQRHMGRSFDDLKESIVARAGITPTFLAPVVAGARRAVETGELQQCEFTVPLPLGERRFFSFQLPEFEIDGAVKSVLTISAQIPDLMADDVPLFLARSETSPTVEKRVVRFGDLCVDLDYARVTRGGQEVAIAPREFRLLAYLVANPNRVLTVEDVLHGAWRLESRFSFDAVRVSIGRLRRLIEPNPAEPRHILTKRGYGYLFVP